MSSTACGFSSDERSPGASPRYAARMTRRMTLALRVFGRSRTNSIAFGLQRLAQSVDHERRQARRRARRSPSDPGRSTQKQTSAWPFISSGTPMAAASSTAGCVNEHRFDLGRADPLAGDLDRVVRAPEDVPEAVLVDRCPVAVHPDVREARPVRLQVALGVVPEAARHADPRRADDQLADLIAHGPALHRRRHQRRCQAEGRRTRGLERRQDVAGDEPAGDLGAARVVDDRQPPAADDVEEPAPRLRDSTARRSSRECAATRGRARERDLRRAASARARASARRRGC